MLFFEVSFNGLIGLNCQLNKIFICFCRKKNPTTSLRLFYVRNKIGPFRISPRSVSLNNFAPSQCAFVYIFFLLELWLRLVYILNLIEPTLIAPVLKFFLDRPNCNFFKKVFLCTFFCLLVNVSISLKEMNSLVSGN